MTGHVLLNKVAAQAEPGLNGVVTPVQVKQ